MAGTSECPKCGKTGLVKRNDQLYQCLICDFKRDFSQAESNSGGGVLGAIAVLLLLLIVLA
jgi:hypothetical protein